MPKKRTQSPWWGFAVLNEISLLPVAMPVDVAVSRQQTFPTHAEGVPCHRLGQTGGADAGPGKLE